MLQSSKWIFATVKQFIDNDRVFLSTINEMLTDKLFTHSAVNTGWEIKAVVQWNQMIG